MRHHTQRSLIATTMLLLVFSLLSGCSSRYVVESNLRPASIETFYATDRNFNDEADRPPLYGAGRDTLSYGILHIRRLPEHAIAKMDDKTLFGGKRHDFVLLDSSLLMKREDFFAQLFRGADHGKNRDILLYVHGYNTTFDKAALTLAQVASDLDFRGAAVFYSWPSTGKLFGYVRDQNNTEWSRLHLKAFLKELAQRAGENHLCLLAHSMGNRELLGALLELKRQMPAISDKIRVIILAAPDVDSAIFCRDMAPLLADGKTLVTIYVARQDKALQASEKVNGYVRAGGVDGEPIVVPGIDTVDVTNINKVPMGHCYFARSRLVLADIYAILNGGLRPKSRFSLSPVELERGDKAQVYWIFEK